MSQIFAVNRGGPPRWPVALKAAVAMTLPVVAATLLGDPASGLMASMGGFAVLYGPTTAGHFWIRLMSLVALGLFASMLVGVAGAGHGLRSMLALVVIAMVATFVCSALRIGPPGAYFFVLVAGIANSAVTHGASPATLLTGRGSAP